MLNVKSFLDDTNLFSPNDNVKNDKIILQNFRQLKGWTNSIALFVVSIFFIENQKNLIDFTKKFLLSMIFNKCKNEDEKYFKKRNQLRYYKYMV